MTGAAPEPTPLPPPALESLGQAAKLAVTDCDAPVTVTVAEHVCGPVPIGGGVPFSFTVISHCVPLGEIVEQPPPAELQNRFIVKAPFASALAFCWPPICVGMPLTMIVGLAVVGISCAETFAKLYGTPFASVIVPETSVGVCASAGEAQSSKRTSAPRKPTPPKSRTSFFIAPQFDGINSNFIVGVTVALELMSEAASAALEVLNWSAMLCAAPSPVITQSSENASATPIAAP